MQIQIPGVEEFRAYSIASPPREKNILEFLVRLVPGGLCSTYIHTVMEVGSNLTLTGPFGDFYLQENSGRSIICIAGGCGMAPIRSILMHLSEQKMPRKIKFFFGARSKKDLFLTEELRKLERLHPNFKYIPALSEPRVADKWEGEVGLITQVVERHVTDAGNSEAYLCGPPPMIDAAIKVLTERKMPPEKVLFDKF